MLKFKALGLQKKLILQTVMTCLLFSGVLLYAVLSLEGVASKYREVSTEQFPKVEVASRMVAKFRLIRIKVRSLAVIGNSEEIQDKYISETKTAIQSFLEEKSKFNNLEFSEEEKLLVKDLDREWENFLTFGKDLLSQYQNPSEESLVKGAHMIRSICPVKAKAWMSVAEKFVALQSKKTSNAVIEAQREGELVRYIVIGVVALTILLSLLQGLFFSSRLTKTIQDLSQKLSGTADEVAGSSQSLLESSSKLSVAASDSAASLQETVSSIDEISSMIQRNSESAERSTQVSANSTEVAMRGKSAVQAMIESITEISKGNDDVVVAMEKNNKDFSKVVEVINEIGEKTKVINDIVFQTKLLSFNASVEAARAGEHGKGFAVVAEEVGNLAAMSGKAALEITEMLESSIKNVNEVVESAKKQVGNLIKESKVKVENGTKTANECNEVLEEILLNVNSVNEMVAEIASASHEQSQGVQEVTKAMQQLDSTTHQNSDIARSSSQNAEKLNVQAEELNSAIEELLSVVSGKSHGSTDGASEQKEAKILNLPRDPEQFNEDRFVDL